jgi:hypothetical protein
MSHQWWCDEFGRDLWPFSPPNPPCEMHWTQPPVQPPIVQPPPQPPVLPPHTVAEPGTLALLAVALVWAWVRR